MHYQLFLPGVQKPDPTILAEFGLKSVFSDGNPQFVRSGGPEGQLGMLLNYTRMRPTDPHSAYFPDWDWRQIGEYWFGTNPADPPKPSDLARDEQREGFFFELKDDNLWIFPTYENVDHVYTIGKDGGVMKQATDSHRDFFDTCLNVQQQIFEALDMVEILNDYEVYQAARQNGKYKDGPEVPVLITDGLGLAAQALAFNYRVNLDICLALELFDDRNLSLVLANIIELPTIVECRDQKKTEGDVAIRVT